MAKILEMNNITKKFLGGKIVANDNVTFHLNKGEILSLVGENGSGKSTLMNILFGLYKQDKGNIYFNGKKVDMYRSGAAAHFKIGMVHQHFHLVDKFTVLENILIGQEEVPVDKEWEAKLLDDKVRYNELLENQLAQLSEEQKEQFKKIKKIDAKITKLMDKRLDVKTKAIKFENHPTKGVKYADQATELKGEIAGERKILKDHLASAKIMNDIFETYVKVEKNKFRLSTLRTANFGVINKKATIRRYKRISEEYGIKLKYDQRIGDLSVGDRQKVEILKILWTDKNIVVFDEPTATLSVKEIEEFLKLVKRLQEKGVSVIFISHKLVEVKAIADRIVVLRKGKLIATHKNTKDLTIKKIAKAMVGDEVVIKYPKRQVSTKNALVVKNLTLVDKNTKKALVDNISFNVKQGEIFGIGGIEGNGQEEILEIISGLTKATSGSVKFGKIDVLKEKPVERSRWISHIPTDRFKHGIVPNKDLAFNSMLSSFLTDAFSMDGRFKLDKISKKTPILIDKSTVQEHTEAIIERLNVEGAFETTILIKDLSGGNQQKFVIGRELEKKHDLLLAGHPTRGLDIKAIDNIYKNIIEETKTNPVVLYSLEMNELLAVCDRVAIMYEGKIVKIIDPRSKTDLKKLPEYMVGEAK